AVAGALLSAVGQFFWWKKIDAKLLWKELIAPLIATVILLLIFLQVMFYQFGVDAIKKPAYLVILFSGLFTITANAKILISLFRSSPGLSGGAIAHIGVGMMLVGIMFSSGYSSVVSLNNTGLLYSR